MQAGKYRHVVACDEPVRNDAGEITGLSFRFTHRARIRAARGREQLHADQIIASTETVIEMRWSPRSIQIDATWRLRHQGTEYNIASIVLDETGRREFTIVCGSGLNNG